MHQYSNESFDKGKWHWGGDYPEDLPEENGSTHIAMYLGWIVDNDLIAEKFASDSVVNDFRERKSTLHELIGWFDDVLVGDMLTEQGARFTMDYYASDEYLTDYCIALDQDVPTLYHISPTIENFQTVSKVIDERYTDWCKSNT